MCLVPRIRRAMKFAHACHVCVRVCLSVCVVCCWVHCASVCAGELGSRSAVPQHRLRLLCVFLLEEKLLNLFWFVGA